MRKKVLQSLYSYTTLLNAATPEEINKKNSDLDIVVQEKKLLESVEEIYDIFLYCLALFPALVVDEINRMEDAKHKFVPTEEDLNPNMKYVNNLFIKKLDSNTVLAHQLKVRQIGWEGEKNLLRQLNNRIKKTSCYKKYMATPENTYHQDYAFVVDIIHSVLMDNDLLEDFFESKSSTWAAHYEDVLYMTLRYIKTITENQPDDSPLPSLYTKKEDDKEKDEDKDFVRLLFRKTILHDKEYEALIQQAAINWDPDRIATIDLICLKMAICELTEFELIPIKVTINEYIELSNAFSSEKSKAFINGLLDRIINELREKGQLHKTGRGLLQN